ncbi:MAG TPA: ammonium transporter [Candidatus Hydrogenedentes bacterium]|nr:ammonium transporter [Candidatus Hydrogenedentota bacterium]HQH51405.1 ammonium transporter [Candidatus Hydrogenedentota bacterium]HQM48542.1 ammonium transporter [Candidatus Hydrogenedentota bacterium]
MQRSEFEQVRRSLAIVICPLAALLLAAPAMAVESGAALQADQTKVLLDILWVLITGFLVFFMNAGFALVESGFCRSKNAVNILTKNFIVVAIASLMFWATGFALMFGDGSALLGLKGFFLAGPDNSPLTDATGYQGIFSSLAWTGVPLEAKFLFQLMFSATAATIVSGAVAERIKFQAYIVFAALLVAFMYPVTGHWIWGGGWLAGIGFHDFAGSAVVHSVGGCAALTGILFLGPRIGKYGKDGSINAIPGHSMALATLGALILWLGWFGFNPGSAMAANMDAARIAATTAMAAAAAVTAATAYAWVRIGAPDLSMIVNGSLAGLVAVTAPCAVVSITDSVFIGLIAGVLVVESVIAFDKLHIDDPVGATSVHLVNGAWGVLAVGLFANPSVQDNMAGLFHGGGPKQLGIQAVGIVAVAVFTIAVSAGFWIITKALVGLRVSLDEEYLGLDKSEMGLEAYPADVTTGEYRRAREA